MPDDITATLRSNGVDAATLTQLTSTDGGDVHMLVCPGGDQAIQLWRRLRTFLPAAGYSPVLLGSEEELESHRERFDDREGPVAAVLAAAAMIDVPEYFRTTRL